MIQTRIRVENNLPAVMAAMDYATFKNVRQAAFWVRQAAVGSIKTAPKRARIRDPRGRFIRKSTGSRTFSYFHTGYSQMNERQLAIGESTCSQRAELDVPFVEGVTRQIMTVEQAQVFSLERCAAAREAIKLIGGLVERYGFLPSCGGSEALCLADPRELWVMEICSVGPDWTPGSGKPGAIWVAKRIPDDHGVVIANHFRVREVDLKDPGTMASPYVVQEAVDRGWYDPKSGRPFI